MNLVALGSALSPGSEVGSGRATLEVSAEHGGQEGTEDELGTTEGGERKPQKEDELEGEVEGEPVDNADKALNDTEEGENDPVGKPLGIIRRARSEESIQGVVSRDEEARDVGQELTTQVEDDQEQVESTQADDGVGLRNTGGSLEVGDARVLGELSVKSTDILLHTILGRRHGDGCDGLLR